MKTCWWCKSEVKPGELAMKVYVETDDDRGMVSVHWSCPSMLSAVTAPWLKPAKSPIEQLVERIG